jgi:hypothetical protein
LSSVDQHHRGDVSQEWSANDNDLSNNSSSFAPPPRAFIDQLLELGFPVRMMLRMQQRVMQLRVLLLLLPRMLLSLSQDLASSSSSSLSSSSSSSLSSSSSHCNLCRLCHRFGVGLRSFVALSVTVCVRVCVCACVYVRARVCMHVSVCW